MNTSQERLEALIADAKVPLIAYTPRMGLDLLLRLYAEDPARGSLGWKSGLVIPTASEHEFGIIFTYRPSRLDGHPSEQTPFYLCFSFANFVSTFPCEHAECREGDDPSSFRAAIEDSDTWMLVSYEHAKGVTILNSMDGPPIRWACMTETEWFASDDVALMQSSIRHRWSGDPKALDDLLQRYWLACSRKIWSLLPNEDSRSGVETAERYLDGLATIREAAFSSYSSEGAAIIFDADFDFGALAYHPDEKYRPETHASWIEGAAKIPIEELQAMLPASRLGDDLSPRNLLEKAAWFAFHATVNPGGLGIETVRKYRIFLPIPLFHEMLGNPYDAI